MGCFLCTDCRAKKLGLEEITESARSIAETAMLIQMSSGAEATGASYYDYKSLEREFMASIGSLLPGGVMPSDDPDVFMMFMCWVVCSKERALSLDSLVRTAGAVMTRTGREDITRRPDVKALHKELSERHGEEVTPRTAITRLMMQQLLERVIPEREGDEVVSVRMCLMFALEVMFGLRVGEGLGAGDFHGLLANCLVILEKLNDDGVPCGVETCEAMLEHSKTRHKRWINAVGVSKGRARVQLARYIREYWRLTGFTIRTRKEGGYLVTGPDYDVVRVSLVALSSTKSGDRARIELLGEVLSRSKSREVRRWAAYSVQRGRQRMEADSLERKYINVVGGPRDCKDICQAACELSKAGFEFDVVPGPLMRATHGKALGFSHMPLQPSSTYKSLHECLDRAYELAKALGDDEIDLRGLAEPLWGHHSIRRGADTVARQTMHITGATERDIDIIFGWNEALYHAMMQLHYESNLQREKRCMVTSMM